MKRIVVKVGSNVLTREDGKLDVTRMSAIVDQIVWLRQQGNEVILVSSGAVAAGRAELHVDHHLDNVEQRQLFSAIGQVKLIGLYYDLFREYKIKIGNTYNYIDILLYNIEFNCYVVVELKVTELRKEHIGQIEIYMNYIDKNIRRIGMSNTIGLIISKYKNEYIIEYSSDSRIKVTTYLIKENYE